MRVARLILIVNIFAVIFPDLKFNMIDSELKRTFREWLSNTTASKES